MCIASLLSYNSSCYDTLHSSSVAHELFMSHFSTFWLVTTQCFTANHNFRERKKKQYSFCWLENDLLKWVIESVNILYLVHTSLYRCFMCWNRFLFWSKIICEIAGKSCIKSSLFITKFNNNLMDFICYITMETLLCTLFPIRNLPVIHIILCLCYFYIITTFYLLIPKFDQPVYIY